MTNEEFTALYCEALNGIQPLKDKYEQYGVSIMCDATYKTGAKPYLTLIASIDKCLSVELFTDGDKCSPLKSERISKVCSNLDIRLERFFKEHPIKTEQEILAEQIADAEKALKEMKAKNRKLNKK